MQATCDKSEFWDRLVLLPERGYIIHDRVAATVAWVREVPSPALAAELLTEHGVEWEGELLPLALARARRSGGAVDPAPAAGWASASV